MTVCLYFNFLPGKLVTNKKKKYVKCFEIVYTFNKVFETVKPVFLNITVCKCVAIYTLHCRTLFKLSRFVH